MRDRATMVLFRVSAFAAAFEHRTWALNSSRRAVGSTSAKPLAATLLMDVQSWEMGRRALPAEPDQAA